MTFNQYLERYAQNKNIGEIEEIDDCSCIDICPDVAKLRSGNPDYDLKSLGDQYLDLCTNPGIESGTLVCTIRNEILAQKAREQAKKNTEAISVTKYFKQKRLGSAMKIAFVTSNLLEEDYTIY